jgi:DNA-directed RNA polymerase subunit E'/Rpb7
MQASTVKKDFRKKKEVGVYMNTLLTRKIQVSFNKIGKNIKEVLEKSVKREIEGKCTVEGYVKSNSVKVLTYSSGVLFENKVEFDVVFECLVCVEFDVVFECLVCCPVEGMLIKCNVKNKTQAGIRAVIGSKSGTDEEKSPIVVYVTRDHHYNNKYFNAVNENEEITIRVIGQRYELNDEQVSVIGEIVEPKTDKIKIDKIKKKPNLVISENI